MNVVILSVVMLNVVVPSDVIQTALCSLRWLRSIIKCDQNHSYDCFELCHTLGLNKLTPEAGLLNKFSYLAEPISMTKLFVTLLVLLKSDLDAKQDTSTLRLVC